MEPRDLVFVVPTYRLRDVGETVEQDHQHFWRNGHSVRIMVFDDSSPANQDKYFPLLEHTHTHNDVYYVGPAEKDQFQTYLNLTEELVRLGHEVTLFATGDSLTTAALVAVCPTALWRDPDVRETLPQHVRLVELVFQQASRFDVIHFHIDYLHFPLVRRHRCATVTTMHGLLHGHDVNALFEEYREVPLVSISDHQRSPVPSAAWQATAMFDASTHFDLQRMPELFCGFARGIEEAPVPYPLACAPQAWAAGSVLLLLQAGLGLQVDGCNRRVVFAAPRLPDGLEELSIHALPLRDASVDLRIVRHGRSVGVNVLNGDRTVEVVLT